MFSSGVNLGQKVKPTSKNSGANELFPKGKPIAFAFIAACLLVLFAMLYLKFIPSKEFARYWFLFAIPSACASLALSPKIVKKEIARLDKDSTWKKMEWTLLAPLFYYFCIYYSTFQAAPAIYTFLVGTEGNMTLTVKDPSDSSLYCARHIQVEEGAFVGDKICNVSKAIRSQLRQGDVICVSGSRSYFGIIRGSASPSACDSNRR